MPQIAIIDDNVDLSGTLKKTLSHYLKKFGSSFTVITQQPFHDISLYFDFVTENEICLLVLDERLNDKPSLDGKPVHYLGNQLVLELRKQLKDFPIVMITTFSDEDDVRARESQFEYMLKRDDITDDETVANLYIPRIIRAAQRYLDSNNKELTEYNDLTKKIAAGETSEELLERLEALQVKLELPIIGYDDRAAWLEKYEEHINHLETLKSKVENILKGK